MKIKKLLIEIYVAVKNFATTKLLLAAGKSLNLIKPEACEEEEEENFILRSEQCDLRKMWIKAYHSRLLLCLALVNNVIKVSIAVKCDRTPEGTTANRSPSDSRFKLRILGEPDRYIPEENYTSNKLWPLTVERRVCLT